MDCLKGGEMVNQEEKKHNIFGSFRLYILMDICYNEYEHVFV